MNLWHQAWDQLIRKWDELDQMFLLLHLGWHQLFYLLKTWVRPSAFFRHLEWDQVHYLRHHEWNQMLYSLTPWVIRLDSTLHLLYPMSISTYMNHWLVANTHHEYNGSNVYQLIIANTSSKRQQRRTNR